MDMLQFEMRLHQALVALLEDRALRFSGETMRAFILGCYPWHGSIYPGFLTTDERRDFPVDTIWEDVGGWRLCDFTVTDSGWRPRVADIGRWMQDQWTEATEEDNQEKVAESFFRACASVVMSDEVVRALQQFRLADDFQIGVTDPDDSKVPNYCCDWKELVGRITRA